MAWYDTVADYTVKPFARGAIFGGAQFLNWGLGKVLPRAIYPEEVERMNAADLEKAKDIFYPYTSAGDGKGNAATATLEFVSGMVGGGAVTKVATKGSAKLLQAAPKATTWVAQHAPKVGQVVQRTGSAVTKAKADVAGAETALANLQNAGASARKIQTATRALDRAKTALETARKTPVFAKTPGAAPGPWATKIGNAIESLSKDGTVRAGEWIGSKWSAHMPYSLGGIAADAAAYGVNTSVPGLITYGIGRGERAVADERQALIRDAMNGFYRDVIGEGRKKFSQFAKGSDIGGFLRAAVSESQRIGKMSGDLPVPNTGDAAIRAKMVDAYRKYGTDLPGVALKAVQDAYKDDQAGYQKLKDDAENRIIEDIYRPYFPNGMGYNPKGTYEKWMTDSIEQTRQTLRANPDYELKLFSYQGGKF